MLLQTSALDLGYPGATVARDVAFQLGTGDVLAVVGHNGSGKSTLVKTLLGVIPALSGRLDWGGSRPGNIAYLGQRTEFDGRFPIRVRDLAAMGAWHGLGFLGHIDKATHTRIDTALDRCGIADLAQDPLHVLSAGQLQRALFARAMVQNAPLVLLDEPFTAIDQTTEAQLLGLIDDWAREGRAIFLVLHDLSAVLQHCTSALLIGRGTSQFGAPREVLTPENLVAHGYLTASQAHWIEQMYARAPDDPLAGPGGGTPDV